MGIAIPRKYIDQAIAQYELAIQRKPQHVEKKSVKLITISRQIGAGGREIAEILCRKLGCTVWGREILDELASQSGSGYQARMFEALDERTQGAIDELVSDFFGRVGRRTYQYLLPKAIFTIAQGDAVFLGRGANLLLPRAFHVRVTASIENRITHMMAREKLSRKAAEKRVGESDHQRDVFLKEFAGTINVQHYRNELDLMINTDRLKVQEAASIVLHGFELFCGESRANKAAAGSNQ
jgi:cytidylate kinase